MPRFDALLRHLGDALLGASYIHTKKGLTKIGRHAAMQNSLSPVGNTLTHFLTQK